MFNILAALSCTVVLMYCVTWYFLKVTNLLGKKFPKAASLTETVQSFIDKWKPKVKTYGTLIFIVLTIIASIDFTTRYMPL